MSGKNDPPDRGKDPRKRDNILCQTAHSDLDMDIVEATTSNQVVLNTGEKRNEASNDGNQSVSLNLLGFPIGEINKSVALSQTITSQINKHSLQAHSSTVNNMENKIINTYSSKDNSPYFVYIQSQDRNIGNLHKIATARIIINAVPEIKEDIVNMSIMGAKKIKVELKSYTSANKLLTASSLKEKNYHAYIPVFYTHKKGVIKQVDIDLSEAELREIIKPKLGYNFEVTHVKRITRKNDKNEIVPTTSIIVTFRGQILPSNVIIEKLVYNVEQYIPRVVQCLKCLRYGHISTQCRSKERCKKCGEEHGLEECNMNEPVCILCKGNHLATEKSKCLEFDRQRNIKRTMVVENMSYVEASSKHDRSYSSVAKSNQSSRYTATVKRKRQEINSHVDEDLARQHKEIISVPKIQSQPVFQSFRNKPSYNNINFNQNSNSPKKTCESILNLIKDILTFENVQLQTGDILDNLRDNILNILSDHV